MIRPFCVAFIVRLLALMSAPAAQIDPARRVLAADDSTRRLAIVAPDGSLEWK